MAVYQCTRCGLDITEDDIRRKLAMSDRAGRLFCRACVALIEVERRAAAGGAAAAPAAPAPAAAPRAPGGGAARSAPTQFAAPPAAPAPAPAAARPASGRQPSRPARASAAEGPDERRSSRRMSAARGRSSRIRDGSERKRMKPAALVLLLIAIAALVAIGVILMGGEEKVDKRDNWEKRRDETSRKIAPERKPAAPDEAPK